MAFTKVANVNDIPPGKVKQITLGARTIAVVHADGQFYAVADTCPHRGASLSEGEVEGKELICPWHGAGFDVATGAHLCPPATSGIATYPVRIVGDEVQVDVEA